MFSIDFYLWDIPLFYQLIKLEMKWNSQLIDIPSLSGKMIPI